MKSATEYVIVEQSVENNEIEYEYKLFKDGFVQDLEIEYEQNRNGAEVEFELKNISPNSSTRTTFKIQKANGTNKFNMIFRKNGTNENVSIEKLTETSYKFTYSNAYSETV